MPGEWYFAPHVEGYPFSNPLGGEHFSEAGEDWLSGESLVRESIQNSLDARAEGENEVSVVIQVSRRGALTEESARFWFGSLWPHLLSPDCKMFGATPKPTSGGFIVVEDFGTRGLDGDIRQGGIGDRPNNFFSFFRAEGLSGKTADAGGSWGVGKSVFNRCSGINSFLAVSVPKPGNDVRVIGKSLLRQHRVAGREYVGVGQFGIKEGPSIHLVLPASDGGTLQRLARDFQLKRALGLSGQDAPEPGLSVVVPYADPEISASGLLSVVIREYFEPILAGRLRVRITGDGMAGRGTVNIDRESIRKEADRLNRRDVSRVIELAEWARDEGKGAAFDVSRQESGYAPHWNEALFRPNEAAFAALVTRFAEGNPVSFHIPVWVHPATGSPQLSGIRVYLRRDLEGDGHRPAFVRGGIVVPNARDRSVRGHALFALITIDEGPLAELLRAAEPPAHTDWSADTANFRNRYQFGKQTINFVVLAPKFIADMLSSARTQRDLDVWADFFPAPDPVGERTAPGAGNKTKKGTVVKPPPPPPAKPKPFKIDQVAGGFLVVRDNGKSTPRPARLEVRVAYDTSRGNALNKYDPADFKLPSLKRVISGAREEACDENLIVLVPEADDFSLEIKGFDEHRDLYVKVKAIAAEGVES